MCCAKRWRRCGSWTSALNIRAHECTAAGRLHPLARRSLPGVDDHTLGVVAVRLREAGGREAGVVGHHLQGGANRNAVQLLLRAAPHHTQLLRNAHQPRVGVPHYLPVLCHRLWSCWREDVLSRSVLRQGQGSAVEQHLASGRVLGDDGGEHGARAVLECAAAELGLHDVVEDVVARVQLGDGHGEAVDLVASHAETIGRLQAREGGSGANGYLQLVRKPLPRLLLLEGLQEPQCEREDLQPLLLRCLCHSLVVRLVVGVAAVSVQPPQLHGR
mmetsp:Transcript_19034/g.73269  ORF Transcript_19034/g.73269 Transcript_19034/m.73269 type:complete len:273 (+) Transcript_19034:2324-3142(+)